MITGQTDNGLRYAVRQAGTAVGYCALSIRCGTRNEEGFPQGIAHFTEHTIFRGTRKRSAANIAAARETGADVLDVNSSLETSPGVKSLNRLAELLAQLGVVIS